MQLSSLSVSSGVSTTASVHWSLCRAFDRFPARAEILGVCLSMLQPFVLQLVSRVCCQGLRTLMQLGHTYAVSERPLTVFVGGENVVLVNLHGMVRMTRVQLREDQLYATAWVRTRPGADIPSVILCGGSRKALTAMHGDTMQILISGRIGQAVYAIEADTDRWPDLVFVGGDDGTVVCYNLTESLASGAWKPHCKWKCSSTVNTIAFSPDGARPGPIVRRATDSVRHRAVHVCWMR
jgi:hypothetical protein